MRAHSLCALMASTLLLFAGACTLIPPGGADSAGALVTPEPGLTLIAAPGDTVATRTLADVQTGLELAAPTRIRGAYIAQPGFYPLIGEDEDHLFFSAPPVGRCPGDCAGRVRVSRFLDQPEALRIPRAVMNTPVEGEVCVVTVYQYRLCGQGAYTVARRALEADDALVQSLVFEGEDGAGDLVFTFNERLGTRETVRSGRPLSLSASSRGVVSVEDIQLDIVDAEPGALVYAVAAPAGADAQDRLSTPSEVTGRRIDPLARLGDEDEGRLGDGDMMDDDWP